MFIKNLKIIVIVGALVSTMGVSNPIKVEAETTDGTVTAHVLNVRSGGSMKYRVIGTINRGDEVNIISYNNGWYKIKYSGKTGWSSARYISKSGISTGKQNNYSSSSTYKKYNTSNKVSSNATSKSKQYNTSKNYSSNTISKSNTTNKSNISKQYNTSSNSYSNNSNTTNNSSSNATGTGMKAKAYAYSGGGRTATGTVPKYGTIAVDPKVIPYGSKVYIKELGQTFIAEDCGGGIKGNKIDIYMNSNSECNNWGVRDVTLEILK